MTDQQETPRNMTTRREQLWQLLDLTQEEQDTQTQDFFEKHGIHIDQEHPGEDEFLEKVFKLFKIQINIYLNDTYFECAKSYPPVFNPLLGHINLLKVVYPNVDVEKHISKKIHSHYHGIVSITGLIRSHTNLVHSCIRCKKVSESTFFIFAF